MRWGYTLGSRSPGPDPCPSAQTPPDPREVKALDSLSLPLSPPEPYPTGTSLSTWPDPSGMPCPLTHPHLAGPTFTSLLPESAVGRLCTACSRDWGLVGSAGAAGPWGFPRQRRAGAAPGGVRSHTREEYGTHVPESRGAGDTQHQYVEGRVGRGRGP